MHVTVRFLGDVDPRVVAPLRDGLRAAAAQTSAGLAVVRFARGGSLPRRVRVYWAGIDDVGGTLRRLEIAVTGAIAPLGIPPEAWPYEPHVTLARVRRERGDGTRSFEEQARGTAAGVCPAGELAVRELVLFESELGRDGTRYRALDRFPLAAR
jgi:2'-5' RNA ligase